MNTHCIPDTAEANRERLQKWSEATKYENITFWISPNMVVTPDECIAEVGKALECFEADKKAGTIKPVLECTENNL